VNDKEKNMIVSIGSRSVPKIIAITRAFSYFPELWMEYDNNVEYIIMPKEVRKDEMGDGNKIDNFSNVSLNPLTLKETINGAKNRAKNAYEHIKNERGECAFGVGIEAGMFPVDEVDTKYMDSSICAIYDGKKYYVGFSPSFEYPQKVVDRVLQGEELGFMTDIFGNTAKGRRGAIGALTKDRVMRDELEEYAVIMALNKITNREMYE
jgi:inosine/xanthosine triphosphatase